MPSVGLLETLLDHSEQVKDVDMLTEYVRAGLSRHISKQYMTPDGQIPVYIERFGNTKDEIFVTAAQLRQELGEKEFGADVICIGCAERYKTGKGNCRKGAL